MWRGGLPCCENVLNAAHAAGTQRRPPAPGVTRPQESVSVHEFAHAHHDEAGAVAVPGNVPLAQRRTHPACHAVDVYDAARDEPVILEPREKLKRRVGTRCDHRRLSATERPVLVLSVPGPVET